MFVDVMNSEIHLFIIWQNARYRQEEILIDINRKFNIIAKYEIQWTAGFVSSNFSRFYGTNLPNNSFKEIECGNGPFLLVIVEDTNPVYEFRETSRGPEMVNVNMFDAKTLYRSWTNGGHKIHGTNNPKETNHDITLLLGKNIVDFINEAPKSLDICHMSKDIEGCIGWDCIEHLFYVLNNTIEYVILRGQDELMSNHFSEDHRDIDLLIKDYSNTKLIINGSSCFNLSRPHEQVVISGTVYYLDLWETRRLYFDPHWIKRMFDESVMITGYRVLDEKNYHFCLLYHSILFKPQISKDYRRSFIDFWDLNECTDQDLYDILLRFLSQNDYVISKPKDKSVHLYIRDFLKSYCHNKGILFSERGEYGTDVLAKPDSFVKIGPFDLINNEVRSLMQLSKYELFPKVIKFNLVGADSSVEISVMNGEGANEFFSSNQNLKWSTLRIFIQNCLEILTILRKERIIHRDFIPQNLLVEQTSYKVSLIDFGWAVPVDEAHAKFCPMSIAEGTHKQDDYSDFYTFGRFLEAKFGYRERVRKLSGILISMCESIYASDIEYNEKMTKLQTLLNGPVSINDFVYDTRFLLTGIYGFILTKFPFLLKVRLLFAKR